VRIGQVCEKTGLSERTVRYYCEERLISPKAYEVSGRVYRDYSHEDVRRLKTIAVLRKGMFSIEEIKTMLASPETIQTVLDGYYERISSELSERIDIMQAIRDIDFSDIASADILAKRMESAFERRSLPAKDIDPDFSRFEPDAPEEKAAAYELFRQRERHRLLWGKWIVIATAVLNVLLSLLSAFVGQFTLLSFVLQFVLSCLLIMGYSWVRYLFIADGFLTALFFPADVCTACTLSSQWVCCRL